MTREKAFPSSLLEWYRLNEWHGTQVVNSLVFPSAWENDCSSKAIAVCNRLLSFLTLHPAATSSLQIKWSLSTEFLLTGGTSERGNHEICWYELGSWYWSWACLPSQGPQEQFPPSKREISILAHKADMQRSLKQPIKCNTVEMLTWHSALVCLMVG